MENEFIPVAVRNNSEGADAKILARFGEPAWNNPVLRFLDGEETDIVPRRDRIWSSGDVAARVVEALAAARREIPLYMDLAMRELSPHKPQRATFAMHCFWEGEVRLGALDGVITTRAGWVGKLEVVEVVFDASRIGYGALLKKAMEMECASKVFVHANSQKEVVLALAPGLSAPIDGRAKDAKPSDDKYRLKKSPLRFLPLTPMQATKINAALGSGQAAHRWLSPAQKGLAKKIEAAIKIKPDAFDHLEPPSSIDGLAAYEDELVTLLAALVEK